MRELFRRVRQQRITRERTFVLALLRRAQLAHESREQQMPYESRCWTDDAEVPPEFCQRVLIRRVDAQLEFHPHALVAFREDANRPRHLRVIRLGKRGECRRVSDVHEWNVELPDLADGANGSLAWRIIDENLKPGTFRRRHEVVEA